MKNLIYLLVLLTPAWFFGQIQQSEYWFDENYSNKVSQNVTQIADFNFQENLNVAALENGIHSFSIRFKDESTNWSSVLTQFFYKLPNDYFVANPKIEKYEYWFDSKYVDKVSQNTISNQLISINENLETTALENGIHSFSIRFQDENGDWSSVMTQFFYKLPDNYFVANPKIQKYEYWFDSNYENKVSQSTTADALVILNENFDASNLVNSIHSFSIRFKDENGDWSSIVSTFFYHIDGQLITMRDIEEYQYWFDDDSTNPTTIAATPSEEYSLDTFVIPQNAGLGIGTHTFHLRFKDNSGMWSSILSESFEIETLAVETPSASSDFKLYPNPTTGELNFYLGNYYNTIKIKVFDLNGRMIFQTEKQNSMELSIYLNVPAGFYVITIEADQEKASRKIIKK